MTARESQLSNLRGCARLYLLRVRESRGTKLDDQMIMSSRNSLHEAAVASDRDIVDAIWEEFGLTIDKPRRRD